MYSFRICMFRKARTSFLKQVCHFSCSGPLATIQLGDSLPSCCLYEDFPTNSIQIPKFVKGKNVIMFGVPGAFAPGCSNTHLPQYLKASDTMRKNGVDEIICVSVNDSYVMGAWAVDQCTKGKIRMFADPTGTFIGALGLGMNIASLGGFRSKRFSMVLIDNVIKEMHVEADGTSLCCSLAHVLGYKEFTKSERSLF